MLKLLGQGLHVPVKKITAAASLTRGELGASMRAHVIDELMMRS